MIHAGNAITVQMLSDGIAEFRFDLTLLKQTVTSKA